MPFSVRSGQARRIRRPFTTPNDTDLVRMESTTGVFTGVLRELITTRD